MRSSGILMHLSSLPSPYGIGTMGAAAREFVDFLAQSGQRYWQVLPLCPTSFGDSPYQSFSTFAGNPYLIDLDDLAADGLLERGEYQGISWGDDPQKVSYDLLYEKRYPLLRRATDRFFRAVPADYQAFCRENDSWLSSYALFMAQKQCHDGAPWYQWEDGLQRREGEALARAEAACKEEVDFWKMLQYLFFRQWRALKAYAGAHGIAIIGDLPIYVAEDSVDVWANPGLFQLDENLRPTQVAGCPPDGFSEAGQLWGNPLFDWETLEKENYAWWIRRIAHQCSLFDVVRIDHFRGFESYYAIPYGAPDARGGCWRPGPGMKLFRAIEGAIGPQNIIAEDLGYLTEAVTAMLAESGFPGMKVLQFAFGGGESYLPHNYSRHCVVYTGTHDNDTILGWLAAAPAAETAAARAYLRLNETEGEHWGMMNAAWASVGDLVVVTLQDVLGLGGHGRMNLPATMGENWRWRALPGACTPQLAQKLRRQTALYGRISAENGG